ncbi:MAG: hypothetical protein HOD64_08810 [Candidatus Cloacimonetes bacterium]|jgi:hypothetical protein|nr:hypothetical protein [Candidatus Cloacimonadota bacterium]MBT4333366.1 hypothetical protein [Candidatus Cloacimonadota bacterium]
MSKGNKTYIVILCCILALKSMAFSSHFVICDFDSESNVEMLHTPKVAHVHNDITEHNVPEMHSNSSCDSSFAEYQYSKCTPCSDTHIYHEVNVSQKRPSTEIEFSICCNYVDKIDIINNTVNNDIINNTDIRQTTYHPTITVLRI